MFVNFLNDGIHATFGTCVDIIVSKDKDFIQKTSFLYDLLDIETIVMSFDEFKSFIKIESSKKQPSLQDCIKNLTLIKRVEIKGLYYFLMKLDQVYGGLINCVFKDFDSNKNEYFFLSVYNTSQLKGILYNELSFITLCLINDLGKDINNMGELKPEEIIDEKWGGRRWIYESSIISFNYFNARPYILIENLLQPDTVL